MLGLYYLIAFKNISKLCSWVSHLVCSSDAGYFFNTR